MTPALVALIAAVAFAGWLLGGIAGRRAAARLVEDAAAYGAGACVVLAPSVLLLVALR